MDVVNHMIERTFCFNVLHFEKGHRCKPQNFLKTFCLSKLMQLVHNDIHFRTCFFTFYVKKREKLVWPENTKLINCCEFLQKLSYSF